MTQAKRKIAVLGGGMASLSAVYALTSRPGWQDDLDITIYQLGWRLGGKAASGRVRDFADRSLEHGYHVLLGFYDNAFATMRACYQELGRAPGTPLSEFCALTPEEERLNPRRYAVRRHYTCQVAQVFKGETHFLPFNLPPNALIPGDGGSVDLWAALDLAFSTLVKAATGRLYTIEPESDVPATAPHPGLGSWIIEALEHLAHSAETEVDRWLSEPLLIHAAHAVWQKLLASRALGGVIRSAELLLVKLIQAHVRHVWEKSQPRIHEDWTTYRDWIMQDTMSALICGILTDEVLTRGFTQLNDVNYVDWWMSHAAVPEGALVSAQSSLGQFPYDLVFGYRHGDTLSPPAPGKPMRGSPDMEAGTMLIGLFHFLLAYKGAPEWMPQAGFGEVLVAPVYEVLRKRGVHVEFFSRVRDLRLDASRRAVDRIVIERQATVTSGTYEPLFDVEGLPSWPSEPFFDQLNEKDALQAQHINLESWWTPWQGQTYELARGTDFDDVLLGISIAALPAITRDLIAASPAWKAMLERVETNRPIIVQTWLTRTIADLGFDYGVINGDIGTQPINLLTSMDQILGFEGWPTERTPKSLIYYSGVLPDDPNQPPPPNAAYPPTQAAMLREAAVKFLEQHGQIYLPKARLGGAFDWSVLACVKDPSRQGRARFDEQYWRVNIDPTERYVLSVTGSSRYRMTAGGSGFENLYLTGDWIETVINAGCMEATISAGLAAAKAIAAAQPPVIAGERSWQELRSGTDQ